MIINHFLLELQGLGIKEFRVLRYRIKEFSGFLDIGGVESRV